MRCAGVAKELQLPPSLPFCPRVTANLQHLSSACSPGREGTCEPRGDHPRAAGDPFHACFYCTPAQRAMSMKFSPPTTLLAKRMARVLR